jgi:hypothetical protein
MRNSAVCVFNALAVRSKGIETGECSRFTQVSVRWAHAACCHHLKQEGNYEVVVNPRPARLSDLRLRRPARTEVVVEAWERGLRAVGGSFERRYRFALPGNVKSRWGIKRNGGAEGKEAPCEDDYWGESD